MNCWINGWRLVLFPLPASLSRKLRLKLHFRLIFVRKSWLNAAISYSMIQSAGKSFGLAVKLGPLFIGTDYMFFGKSTKTVNGFVGISVPLGGKKSSKRRIK